MIHISNVRSSVGVVTSNIFLGTKSVQHVRISIQSQWINRCYYNINSHTEFEPIDEERVIDKPLYDRNFVVVNIYPKERKKYQEKYY